MKSNTLTSVLEYADLGYRLFPIQAGHKMPLPGSHGCLDATSDQDALTALWADGAYNIGLSTDGLIVVDVEASSPWMNDEQLRKLLATGAACQVTANGGRHFFFRQPAGLSSTVRNSASKLAVKVDIRATGGYVVVAPSVLAGDRRYRWVEGCELPHIEQLPEAPSWITESLIVVATSERCAVEVDGGPIPAGVRNDVLARLAGTMRRVGLGKAAIEAALQTVNRDRCRPPLADEEVGKIAWSVARYSPDLIAQAGAECWWEQLAETQDTENVLEQPPGDLPGHLLRPEGLLGDIIDFNLATALYPQPVMALAGALCLMGAMTGRKIMDERGTRTNLQVLVLAPSGSGKDHARYVNKQLLTAAAAVDLVGPDRLSSHAGIISTLAAQPTTLFQPDEFHGLIASVASGRNSPWLRSIPEVLKEVYSAAKTLWKPTAYGDAKANLSIDQPHAVLHCTGVSEWFWDTIGRELIVSGFVGRMLLFDLPGGSIRPSHAVAAEPPAGLVDQLRWWRAFAPGGNLGPEHPQPMLVTAAGDAVARLYDHMEAVRQKQADDSAVGAAIWGRSAEKSAQLALVIAASRQTGRDGPMVIARGDVNLAIAINNWSTRWLVWCAVHRSTDGEHHRRVQKFLGAIPEKWITGRQLCRRTHQQMDAGARKRILDDLIEAGKVERRVVTSKTKPTTEYRRRSAD